MSSRTAPAKGARKSPVKERRADPGAAGALRQLKGLLSRPIGLERRGGQLHIVLVERRRAQAADALPSVSQVRTEVRARVLAHRLDNAAQVMRHLVQVHDELGRRGWAGVQALSAETLARAVVQAEMLASEESSPSLALLVDRLRQARTAASLREERASELRAAEANKPMEVSETTHEAFEEVERSWVGTLPPAQARPDKAD